MLGEMFFHLEPFLAHLWYKVGQGVNRVRIHDKAAHTCHWIRIAPSNTADEELVVHAHNKKNKPQKNAIVRGTIVRQHMRL